MSRAPRITSVADGLHHARRRLPAAIMQTFENGAGELITLRANERALEETMFRPVGGVWHDSRDLGTTVLGHDLRTPLIASSIGVLGLGHPDGEAGVARAIGDAGGIQFVSTFTSQPIEDIVAAASGPVYFQLYFIGSREANAAMIERARDAGCAGLVLCIDSVAGHTPVRSRPVRERRHLPADVSPGEALRFAPQLIRRPGWAADFARGRVTLDLPMAKRPDGTLMQIGEAAKLSFGEAPTWEDLAWIREVWNCPIVIKGVLSEDDGRRAVEAGAAAIVVSNHGGNRLDGTLPSLDVLPAVVDAVGDQIDVVFDSGVRRGTDVVKAMALGAKAVGLGRAYLYPLLGAGEPGVRQILEVFRRDIDNTLQFLGCRSLAELTPEHLVLRAADGATRVR